MERVHEQRRKTLAPARRHERSLAPPSTHSCQGVCYPGGPFGRGLARSQTTPARIRARPSAQSRPQTERAYRCSTSVSSCRRRSLGAASSLGRFLRQPVPPRKLVRTKASAFTTAGHSRRHAPGRAAPRSQTCRGPSAARRGGPTGGPATASIPRTGNERGPRTPIPELGAGAKWCLPSGSALDAPFGLKRGVILLKAQEPAYPGRRARVQYNWLRRPARATAKFQA